MRPVLRFHDVRKTFRVRPRGDALRDAIPRLARRVLRGPSPPERFVALDGCSLSVAPGEVLALVGANGSGKSTALRVAAGIYPIDAGTLSVRGRASALIELAAGFHPDLSGRENVFLAGALLGLRRREVQAVFDRIVAFADIGAFLDAPVRTYSWGMGLRLGFAVAAHVPAELLLIDEVLAVGDAEYRARCLRRMAERRAEGAAIVLVSHNLLMVEQFADRVLVLDRGRVVGEGPPRATLDAYRARVLGTRPGGVVAAALPQLRRGTGEARLERVELRGGGGVPEGSAVTGGALRIRLEWTCAAPIAEPTIGVAFHTAEGQLVAELQSRPSRDPRARLRCHGAAVLEIDALPLLPGSYGVSAYVRDADGLVDLDHHQALHVLRVIGERREHCAGTIAICGRWRREPAFAAASDG